MSHTQPEAEALRDKVLSTMRDTYDHVRTTAVRPGGIPDSRVKVLARRRDNHLIEEEL